MAKTATATKATQVAKTRTPKTYTLDVGTAGLKLLVKLANARAERLNAERTERPLKESLATLYADMASKLKPTDRIQVTARGNIVGEVVCVSGAKKVDMDLLLSAFPEAYQHCVSDTTHLRFSPA